MAPIVALWVPIVLSAVIVFIASSIMHVVLKYHQSDCKRLPDEDKLLAAIRGANPDPGLYMMPYCEHGDMKSSAIQEKIKQGPVGMIVLRPSGNIPMGKLMGMWFGFCLVVAFFTAYLTAHTVAPGANYLVVFRVAGTAAFMAYGLGNIVNSIWKGMPWGMTIKEVVDGLVYGLLTAGTFGWLWPR